MAQSTPIDIALQGGGAHGAYTWGVLDRLLEEPAIEIVGVSGTSAGGMNAIALVQGLAEGAIAGDPALGRERARALLTAFWERVADAAAFSPVQRSVMARAMGIWSLEYSPIYRFFDGLTQAFSPYELNPLNINPLRRILDDTFDFALVNAPEAPRLFLSATNVRTGQLKLFRQPAISADTALASACLPNVYQAVEIDNKAYWDGGFMGNPPLYPLVNESPARDAVIVQINPFERADVPRTANDINDRLNEITFNASLIFELRSLGFLYQLIKAEDLDNDAFQNGRLHRIAAEDVMRELDVSSKMNAEMRFLRYLFGVGRDSAANWLATDGQHLGKRSTWLPAFLREEDSVLAERD
ncbi:MAG: patatin-like phospholipase family protein [Pseudomonadota bacterium]